MDVNIFGWLAAISFSLCSVPQAFLSYKQKHSDGVSWLFLILWSLGEIFATIYVAPRLDYPLLANYFFNMIFIAIIIYYKVKGANSEQRRS